MISASKTLLLLLLLSVNPALACDPQACVAKAQDLTRKFSPLKSAEDKSRTIQYLDLHKNCACGVLEGSYGKVYPAMAKIAAGRLKKYDGTSYDMAWLKQAESKIKSQVSVARMEKSSSDKLRYGKMLADLKATSDWSAYKWTFGGSAYEQSENPCMHGSVDEHLKNGCTIKELYSDKGILFLSCPASFPNVAFGVAGFYLDKQTCDRCVPHTSVTANNRFPDKSARCFDDLTSKFGN